MKKNVLIVGLFFLFTACQAVSVPGPIVTMDPTNTVIPATATSTVRPTSIPIPPTITPTFVVDTIHTPFEANEWGEGNFDFTCYEADFDNIQAKNISLPDGSVMLRWTTCFVVNRVTKAKEFVILPCVTANYKIESSLYIFSIVGSSVPRNPRQLTDFAIDDLLGKTLGAVEVSGKVDVLLTTGNNPSSLLTYKNPFGELLSNDIWGSKMLDFGKTGEISALPTVRGLSYPIVIPYRVEKK